MSIMIREGAVCVNVEGVFYNPRMKLNRDICVALVRELGIVDYLDALASSGIRGIRVALEADVKCVTLNDVSLQAYDRILENVSENGLTCSAINKNANVLLHETHFEAVDLDPFGSPSPFISSSARSALDYLFMTATDTAPLCGAHLKSGIRKYMSIPQKTDYHREMGARILLGLAVRELARVDKATVPLLTHVSDHYARCYLKVEKGSAKADQSLDQMGYVEHCYSCGSWVSHRGLVMKFNGRCTSCGSRTVIGGPLWLGPIQNPSLISDVVQRQRYVINPISDRATRLLKLCGEEIDEPFYYDYHKICRKLKLAPKPTEDVVSNLRDHGWQASCTHFTGVGIKTNAKIHDLEYILK